jgi:hypothetical protein
MGACLTPAGMIALEQKVNYHDTVFERAATCTGLLPNQESSGGRQIGKIRLSA